MTGGRGLYSQWIVGGQAVRRKPCRHVVFGPRCCLGIGARDLVTERGVQQTLMFVKHVRSDQDLSELLCIGLKWFQLHADIARPILECPSLPIPYLEVGCFRTLRKFLCFINAEVHINNLRAPQTLQANDHAIMETFLDTHQFSDKDLSRLNLCCIYLRVEFLSEICNPEGDNILPEVWQGRRPQESSSDLLWPNQARRFEKSWSLWRSAQAGLPKP